MSFFQSQALGAILVVIASIAATLTLLPAVLTLLAPRFNLLTLPFPGESTSRAATEKMASLRDTLIPAVFDGVPAEVYVGGIIA